MGGSLANSNLMVKDRDKQAPEAAGQAGRGEVEITDDDRGDNGRDGNADAVAEDPASLLAEAQHQLTEARDGELRARAELENTRKRASKEIERIRQYALESFASALLGVKDNLERSLTSQGKPDADYRKRAVILDNICAGVGLTLKSLEQVFSDFGIEEVAPLEQTFDPELHQAISTSPTADHPPNTVIELVQKGYTLNGRLLRAAMVVVAAAPREDASVDERGTGDQDGQGEDASQA